MQKAVTVIKSTEKPKYVTGKNIKPTHFYVVFIPENMKQIELLAKMVTENYF